VTRFVLIRKAILASHREAKPCMHRACHDAGLAGWVLARIALRESARKVGLSRKLNRCSGWHRMEDRIVKMGSGVQGMSARVGFQSCGVLSRAESVRSVFVAALDTGYTLLHHLLSPRPIYHPSRPASPTLLGHLCFASLDLALVAVVCASGENLA
jgi:hypothetical protein